MRVPVFPAGPGSHQEGSDVPSPYSVISCSPTLLALSPTDTGHLLCEGTPASLAMPQVTKLPEGGISGQTGIFEKVLLFCLQELLVFRLEPDDVDFDPLRGVNGLHQQP